MPKTTERKHQDFEALWRAKIADTSGLSRAQALVELQVCYAEYEGAQELYLRIAQSQRGWIGRQAVLEDAMSDAEVYGLRIAALERFLASEPVR